MLEMRGLLRGSLGTRHIYCNTLKQIKQSLCVLTTPSRTNANRTKGMKKQTRAMINRNASANRKWSKVGLEVLMAPSRAKGPGRKVMQLFL